jgi:hypothetical protein
MVPAAKQDNLAFVLKIIPGNTITRMKDNRLLTPTLDHETPNQLFSCLLFYPG